MIQERMMDTIAALEAFDEMRVEERRPPLRFTDRDPGVRPSETEDPVGAFIRRCRVKGAEHVPRNVRAIVVERHPGVADECGPGAIRILHALQPACAATDRPGRAAIAAPVHSAGLPLAVNWRLKLTRDA